MVIEEERNPLKDYFQGEITLEELVNEAGGIDNIGTYEQIKRARDNSFAMSIQAEKEGISQSKLVQKIDKILNLMLSRIKTTEQKDFRTRMHELTVEPMQEIQISDEYLEQAKEKAAEDSKGGWVFLQVLPNGEIFISPKNGQPYIGSAFMISLEPWDPSRQSKQDKIDDIALAFEEARMQAEQLVEIV